MRVELRKVRTTAAERTWARTMDPVFGPLPDDLDDGSFDEPSAPATLSDAAAPGTCTPATAAA
jgi:hypothetical protein